MHPVKQIKIKRFRRLHDVTMEMRSLMVMIGANGVGKTSMLDAISLLSASAAGKLNQTLNGIGGIVDVCTRGCLEEGLTLEAQMTCPSHEPLEYKLHLATKGQAYTIDEESLSQQRQVSGQPFKHIEAFHNDIRYFDTEKGGLARPEWESNPLESSLSQVPKMFREPEIFRRVLSSVTQYHVLDVGQRAPVKLPQQMKPADMPGVDGEDLVSFLYNLRESNHDRYEIIEDTLKSAFPGFELLNFPPVAAGMLSMTWKEKQFKDPLYMHQLSEGTLRFLWLISLLQSPHLSTVTMIDEPEVSFHPELLSILAELMRESSKRTQIIVATHSDRLIRFLKPEEVVVMDIDDNGFTNATWADTLALDEWLKEYSLDEVWRLGRMGGRA